MQTRKNVVIRLLMQMSAIAILFLIKNAYAQSSESPIGQGLGYIVNAFIYGTDGTVLAIIAFAGSGIAALYHKIHWSVFVGVVAAISIIFGAPAIVSGIKSLVSAG